MSEWQPIETVPKDTRVWLYDPYTDPEQFVGSYVSTLLPTDDPDYWEGWVFADEILINHTDYEPEPTHWMPLPPPPSTPQP